jgi:hypothetical protein
MNEIPALYWMILIGGLSTMFGLILYYTAMLLREATGAVSDSRKVIQNSNRIVEETSEIVSAVKGSIMMIKGTIDTIHNSLLAPLGEIAEKVGGFLGKNN